MSYWTAEWSSESSIQNLWTRWDAVTDLYQRRRSPHPVYSRPSIFGGAYASPIKCIEQQPCMYLLTFVVDMVTNVLIFDSYNRSGSKKELISSATPFSKEATCAEITWWHAMAGTEDQPLLWTSTPFRSKTAPIIVHLKPLEVISLDQTIFTYP